MTAVRAILDALGIERSSVTGSSGGGPHVLAVAAGLGERVDRARCNLGLAPYDADDVDFFAGMDPRNGHLPAGLRGGADAVARHR